MKFLKSFLPRLALMLFSLGITIVLLEFGLRMVTRGVASLDILYGEYDPILGSTNYKNLDIQVPFADRPDGFHFVTNSQGLREETEISPEKPAGQKRILVIGDSHTSGLVDIPDTYPNVLEARLEEAGDNVEVINAGVGAYSPLQELLWFHLYGKAYQPDIVILGIYIGNDFSDLNKENVNTITINLSGEIILNGEMKQPRPQTLMDRIQRTYLYNLVINFQKKLAGEETITPDQAAAAICGGCYWQHLWQVHELKAGPFTVEQSLGNFEVILSEFNRQAQAINAELVVAIIPSRNQVEAPLEEPTYRDAMEAIGLTQADTTVEKHLTSGIISTCVSLEIPTVSMVEPLVDTYHSLGQPLYYPHDWHMNEAGNRVIGDTLSSYFLGTGD